VVFDHIEYGRANHRRNQAGQGREREGDGDSTMRVSLEARGAGRATLDVHQPR
jgi:hypothetical protein